MTEKSAHSNMQCYITITCQELISSRLQGKNLKMCDDAHGKEVGPGEVDEE